MCVSKLSEPTVTSVSPDSGSIPEEDEGRLYNTCAVFGPDGELLLRHRKVSAVASAAVGARGPRAHHGGMAAFPTSRFISLTSTFRGKSASRSRRPSARAALCRCSKHVSGASSASSGSGRSQAGPGHLDSPCVCVCPSSPQRSVKWAWGFATTSDLRSWRSSTAGEVRVGRARSIWVLGVATS